MTDFLGGLVLWDLYCFGILNYAQNAPWVKGELPWNVKMNLFTEMRPSSMMQAWSKVVVFAQCIFAIQLQKPYTRPGEVKEACWSSLQRAKRQPKSSQGNCGELETRGWISSHECTRNRQKGVLPILQTLLPYFGGKGGVNFSWSKNTNAMIWHIKIVIW